MARAVIRATCGALSQAITCTEGSWTVHVLAHHPEMSGHEADATLVLQEPDIITQDVDYADRRCLYRLIPGISTWAPYLKVVIKLPSRLSLRREAYVITAYPVSAVKTKEAILWQRPPAP